MTINRAQLKEQTGLQVAVLLGHDPADVAGVAVEPDVVRVVTTDQQVHLHEIVEG